MLTEKLKLLKDVWLGLSLITIQIATQEATVDVLDWSVLLKILFPPFAKSQFCCPFSTLT